MRAVIQRVSRADVVVEERTVAEIGRGIVLLVGVEKGDTEGDADYIAKKTSSLRIFEDEAGKMNLSVKDIAGEVLCVSQFTLLADARKGRRPSFDGAESPERAEALYKEVAERVRKEGIVVKEGVFGGYMKVSLTNDGPVTILLDSKKTF
ncbi:MAG TPA: D-tyrosyl-tRNA(Tyr) deacylase [Deltaproteobacteria bacterium]|nr:D-tyrosyl-tRNA(Tyr) deacylase [Deltaproteobacteria bacterium]